MMRPIVQRNRHGFLTWRSWRNIVGLCVVEWLMIGGVFHWFEIIV
jgi:hypothetical protein